VANSPGILFINGITPIPDTWFNAVNNAVYNFIYPNISNTSTPGYVLTYVSASSPPTWQAASGGIGAVHGTTNQIDVSTVGSTATVSIDSGYPATLTLAESQITNLTSDLSGKQASNANLTTLSTNSITGTSNRTTVSATYAIDISASYVGQTSITTLGTISTGSIPNTLITGLGTLSTQSGTFSGTSSGTNTGDQTIALTGNVTGSGTGSFATTIAASAVQYSMIQNVSANSKLLGSSSSGSGVAPSEITLGTNLTMSGSTLNASGSGGSSNWGSPDLVSYTYFGGV
jgi:hypothetical protein